MASFRCRYHSIVNPEASAELQGLLRILIFGDEVAMNCDLRLK
jgi:hypothetical protein